MRLAAPEGAVAFPYAPFAAHFGTAIILISSHHEAAGSNRAGNSCETGGKGPGHCGKSPPLSRNG
jgi:hypothetical protein